MPRLNTRLLLLGALLLALLLLGTDVVSSELVRTALTLPVVLVVPGYCLLDVFPSLRTAPREYKALYTVTLSIALAMLTGLALDWTPWGLSRSTWALSIGLICVVALGLRAVQPAHSDQTAESRSPTPRLSAISLGGFVLATLLASGAVWVSARPAAPSAVNGYTSLWIAPSPAATPTAVRLGVQSMEFDAQKYRLELEIDGRATKTWTLTLAPGQQWEENVSLDPASDARSRVAAVLYRLDAPTTIYRRVSLNREP